MKHLSINIKLLIAILVHTSIVFLVSCKSEEKLEITSIAVNSNDVIDICEAKFRMGFNTFVNKEDVTYEWFLDDQFVSDEKCPPKAPDSFFG